VVGRCYEGFLRLPVALADAVERTLALAREALGMDVALVSKFAEDRMEFRALEGDAGSFGWQVSGGVPLEGTFCKRVVEGTLPNVVPDAGSDGRVSGLEVTHKAGIGSYVGLPLRFSDGRVYGTLCCLSHSAEPRLQERDARFMEVLARLVADQIEREELEAERRRLEVRATGVGALLAALEARDGYTGDHSRAVVEQATAVARRMGLSEEEVDEVEQVALLHDVGKIGVGDAILNKPGPLNQAEREVMRMHPMIGEQIVASTEGLSHLAPAIGAEHERWDGKGYPDGLSGEGIPIASRIVLVCDAFHAMTSNRPYREALGVEAALGELEKNAGTQFCPRTVEAFVGMVGQGPE
jgi:response regulator RpfG family c-di-GMP phosphodiesterase